MNTEKLKIKMKRILPQSVYLFGLKLWRKARPIIYKHNLKKLEGFTKPFYKKMKVNDREFYLLISKDNGLFDETIYLSDVYEEEATNIILSQIKKTDIFLDVGSNIGYFPNL